MLGFCLILHKTKFNFRRFTQISSKSDTNRKNCLCVRISINDAMTLTENKCTWYLKKNNITINLLQLYNILPHSYENCCKYSELYPLREDLKVYIEKKATFFTYLER